MQWLYCIRTNCNFYVVHWRHHLFYRPRSAWRGKIQMMLCMLFSGIFLCWPSLQLQTITAYLKSDNFIITDVTQFELNYMFICFEWQRSNSILIKCSPSELRVLFPSSSPRRVVWHYDDAWHSHTLDLIFLQLRCVCMCVCEFMFLFALKLRFLFVLHLWHFLNFPEVAVQLDLYNFHFSCAVLLVSECLLHLYLWRFFVSVSFQIRVDFGRVANWRTAASQDRHNGDSANTN